MQTKRTPRWTKHDDSEKREMKSAAWQQVTGAIGHSADGLYNTSFYWDACREFSPVSISKTHWCHLCVETHSTCNILAFIKSYTVAYEQVSHMAVIGTRDGITSHTSHTNKSLYVTHLAVLNLAVNLCVIWEKSIQHRDDVTMFSVKGFFVALSYQTTF